LDRRYQFFEFDWLREVQLKSSRDRVSAIFFSGIGR
jgi:hypothetical protein